MSTKLRAMNYASTPTPEDVRMLFGAIMTGNWRDAFVARGYGWHFDTQAAFATAIVGGGDGTVADLDQPEVGISVPSGTTIIPLDFNISVNPGVNAADN